VKTLEQYLRDEFARSGAIDHSLRAEVGAEGVRFYIHPSGRDGDTRDFLVVGNELRQNPSVTYPEDAEVSS
jgi:hypothetical protein